MLEKCAHTNTTIYLNVPTTIRTLQYIQMIQLQYEYCIVLRYSKFSTNTLHFIKMFQLQYKYYNNIYLCSNYNKNTKIYLEVHTTILILQYIQMFQLQYEYYNIYRCSNYNTNTTIYLNVPTTIRIILCNKMFKLH